MERTIIVGDPKSMCSLVCVFVDHEPVVIESHFAKAPNEKIDEMARGAGHDCQNNVSATHNGALYSKRLM